LTNVCTLATSSPYAGIATAGCAIVGNTTYTYYELLDLFYCNIQNRQGIAEIATADCALAA